MSNIHTIAYVHSSICEAIIFEGMRASSINLSGVVYGRNYNGDLHNNSLTLLEDQIMDDLTLLSCAVMFQNFINRMKIDNIRLILPHFYNPLFKLFSSHIKVKEVYFMEEGNLSYGNNHYPNDSWRMAVEKKINYNVLLVIKNLGYLLESDELYFHGSENWYGDPWGKYRGSIVSNPNALFNFPGERININLKLKNVFASPAGLLLISNPKIFFDKSKMLAKHHEITINDDNLYKLLLNVICELIADEYSNLLNFTDVWYYKIHPSVLPSDSLFFEEYLSIFFKNWIGSEAHFKCQGMDLSYINFKAMCSIGRTSAERYAKEAHGSNYDFYVIDENAILSNLLKKLWRIKDCSATPPIGLMDEG